jgi:CheY-like chemotaxis protein
VRILDAGYVFSHPIALIGAMGPSRRHPDMILILTSVDDERASSGSVVARVVLAEDNRPLLDLFTGALTGAGHTVLPCRDGASALAHARSDRPDLLITDLDMPCGMTGLQLVAEVKSDPATRHIPVIVVTGSVSARSGAAAVPDVTCWLDKPVLPVDLVRHVAAILTNDPSRDP